MLHGSSIREVFKKPRNLTGISMLRGSYDYVLGKAQGFVGGSLSVNRLTAYILGAGLLVGCGSTFESNGPNEASASSVQGDAWVSKVGGTLSEISATRLLTIKGARFYRMYSPIGFGINHEFIGVETVDSTGQVTLYVTGLMGQHDPRWFKTHKNNLRWSRTIRTVRNGRDAQTLINRINTKMARTAYNNSLLYTTAMVTTPVTGRPCANVAGQLERLIYNY